MFCAAVVDSWIYSICRRRNIVYRARLFPASTSNSKTTTIQYTWLTDWWAGEENLMWWVKSIGWREKWELKPENTGRSSLPCIPALNWLYCFVLWWLTAHQWSNVLYVRVQGEADGRRSGWSKKPLQDTGGWVHGATSWEMMDSSHHSATVMTEGGLCIASCTANHTLWM